MRKRLADFWDSLMRVLGPGEPVWKDPTTPPKALPTYVVILLSVGIGFGLMLLGAIITGSLSGPDSNLLLYLVSEGFFLSLTASIFITMNGSRRQAPYWLAGERHYKGLLWALGIAGLVIAFVERRESAWLAVGQLAITGGLLLVFLSWFHWLRRVLPQAPAGTFGDAGSSDKGPLGLKKLDINSER
jgi:hypothetical protein